MAQNVLDFKLEYSENEEITPYAGLGIYAELYKAIGLDKQVKRRFPEPGSGAGFEANVYVESLALMMIGGGRTIEDIRKIQADHGLQRISKIKCVPTADAAGDWMRRGSEKKIESLKQISDHTSQQVLKKAQVNKVTVDIDATGIEAEKYEAECT